LKWQVAMDASYWHATFRGLLQMAHAWSAEQTRSTSILAALAEFHSRLRAIKAGSHEDSEKTLGVLSQLDGLAPRLIEKHLRGMENLMRGLRRSVSRFEELQTEIGALHSSVWYRYKKCASQLSTVQAMQAVDVVVGAGQGHAAQKVRMPPPLQCLEWIEEVDRMFCEELLLKLRLIDSIDFAMSTQTLKQLVCVWSLRAQIRQPPLDRLASLATSLTLA